MKRYDLRHLKGDFLARMGEILDLVEENEAVIFLFEIGDFSSVENSAKMVKSRGFKLLNSLRFNEVDWTIIARRENPESKLDSNQDSNLEAQSAQDLETK